MLSPSRTCSWASRTISDGDSLPILENLFGNLCQQSQNTNLSQSNRPENAPESGLLSLPLLSSQFLEASQAPTPPSSDTGDFTEATDGPDSSPSFQSLGEYMNSSRSFPVDTSFSEDFAENPPEATDGPDSSPSFQSPGEYINSRRSFPVDTSFSEDFAENPPASTKSTSLHLYPPITKLASGSDGSETDDDSVWLSNFIRGRDNFRPKGLTSKQNTDGNDGKSIPSAPRISPRQLRASRPTPARSALKQHPRPRHTLTLSEAIAAGAKRRREQEERAASSTTQSGALPAILAEESPKKRTKKRTVAFASHVEIYTVDMLEKTKEMVSLPLAPDKEERGRGGSRG